jgi:hypothetical protein
MNWTKHGTCTGCGDAVGWAKNPGGRWRLLNADGREHDCPRGGYRPGRRARWAQEALDVELRAAGLFGSDLVQPLDDRPFAAMRPEAERIGR